MYDNTGLMGIIHKNTHTDLTKYTTVNSSSVEKDT